METWSTKSGYKIIKILSGRSNVFLVTSGEKNFLVDTGPSYRWGKLQRRLNLLNITNIDYLILTHSHSDHSGNAASVKSKYGSLVFVHKDEASYLTSGKNVIPDGTTFLSRIILNKFIKNIYAGFRIKPCQYDYLVDSELDLKKFGFDAFILHTPGHTPGSMSVIVDNEVALTGDAMFGVFRGSVFPPFGIDANMIVRSWGKLLETGCSLFIPSHGSANSRSLVQREFNKRSLATV